MASSSSSSKRKASGAAPGQSPQKLTRSAAKILEGAAALLSPGLDKPEPRKNRPMVVNVIIDYTEGAPPLFGSTAEEIRAGVLAAVAQVQVNINDHDPRPGCFVVRLENGDDFLSLLGMNRPFAPLRNLNVQRLVQRIVQVLLGDNRGYYEDNDDA